MGREKYSYDIFEITNEETNDVTYVATVNIRYFFNLLAESYPVFVNEYGGFESLDFLKTFSTIKPTIFFTKLDAEITAKDFIKSLTKEPKKITIKKL